MDSREAARLGRETNQQYTRSDDLFDRYWRFLHNKIYAGMACVRISTDDCICILWIMKHYEAVGEQLRVAAYEPAETFMGNVIILPVSGITHVVEQSINYAKSLSADQIIACIFLLKEVKNIDSRKSGISGNPI